MSEPSKPVVLPCGPRRMESTYRRKSAALVRQYISVTGHKVKCDLCRYAGFKKCMCDTPYTCPAHGTLSFGRHCPCQVEHHELFPVYISAERMLEFAPLWQGTDGPLTDKFCCGFFDD